ncbi:MAG: hypothetical protein AAFQ89_01770 [Cyanobacteria bacterium J06626_18]
MAIFESFQPHTTAGENTDSLLALLRKDRTQTYSYPQGRSRGSQAAIAWR